MRTPSVHRLLRLVVAGTSLIVVGGCGGGGGGGSVTPQPINRAPSVSLVQPPTDSITLDVRQSPTCDLTIRAEDPDGGKLSCIWTWDAGSVQPADQTVDAGSQVTACFTPPECDGQCKLKVTVSDGDDSAVKELAVNVTGHSTPPGTQLSVTSMTVTPNPVTPSASASVAAVVNNPGGKTLTCTWKSRFGTVSGSGRTVSWRAPNVAGVYGVYVTVSDGTATAQGSTLITVSGSEGGLLGQYFETDRYKGVVRFTNMAFQRTDPAVNFHWMKLSPDVSRLPVDGFGVKWTGYVRCEEPGTYVFRVFVDDGARMKLMNDLGQWVGVIPDNAENWDDHTEGAYLPAATVPVQLQGNKWYPIQLEFFEGAGDAFIYLYWSVNGKPEVIVPQEALKPPS